MNSTVPTFTVLTWGCQMNEDDSEQIASLMTRLGYQRVASALEADVVFLNTCSVRAKPEHKAKSKLGELRILKQQNPDLIVAVCGCMAQKEGERIRSYAPFVDLIIGTANIHQIPGLLHRITENRDRISALELPRVEDDEPTVPIRVERTPRLKAFVPIMYGCDNFCAYCVVPFTRGPERSRPMADILAEVERLVGGGCKEVTLLGQNVNNYGQGRREPTDFPTLLYRLNDVPGIERIRFTTSHPKDLSDGLIRAMAELPKVCEHLHLPVQSGSDAVLARMNRRYTSAQYLQRLTKLRDTVPDIAVTTDLLVGFPGETDEDFEATLRLVEEVRFDEAFMFAFSPMSGTAAADMPDQLSDPVRHERLLLLIELQNRITAEINHSQLGMIFEILVEGVSRRDSTKVTGLTRTNKTMNFTGDAGLIGLMVSVRAVKPHIWGFMGEADSGR